MIRHHFYLNLILINCILIGSVSCLNDGGNNSKSKKSVANLPSTSEPEDEVEKSNHDIVLLLDGSGSIGENNFIEMRDAIASAIAGVSLAKRNISFSLNLFATGSSLDGSFYNTRLTNENLSTIQTNIEAIQYPAGWSYVHSAIEEAYQNLVDNSLDDSEKVIALVVDGVVCAPTQDGGCPQSVCNMADQLREEGIRFILIGVGSDQDVKNYYSCLVEDEENDIFMLTDFYSVGATLSSILQ